MKRSLPLAAAIASAAALALPALADANTYCVAKPDCVAAGGTNALTLEGALSAAALLSPGPDRIEIGPGDFTAMGGYQYLTMGKDEAIDIVGSGRGVTRLHNSSTNTVEKTLQLGGAPYSSVSDLSIVAPTPAGAQPVVWALVLSGTARRIDISGAHDFIAVQLSVDSRLEDSSVHGDAAYAAVSSTGSASISDSSIESAGIPTSTSNSTLDVSRTRIDAHSGPIVSGAATVTIADSLILTHGGPGLRASTGASATLHATGDTIVGDNSGSVGVSAGEGGAGHAAHVTVANTVISGYGHSIITNQSGGSADVKLSHSDFDDTTVLASAGQVDMADANIHDAPGFVDAAGGDFHLAAASPLIDAGDPGPASQSDLEGSQRTLDGNGDGTAAPDIGAFESPVLSPPTPPTTDPPATDPPGQPSGGGNPPPVTSPDVAPRLTAFTVAKRRIQRGRRTSFRFTVSKASRVRITIKRLRPRPAGHAAGSLSRKAHAGRNKVAFRGRIGRRSLKPGRYVAIAQATDSAGKRSAKRTLRFTLLAPRLPAKQR